MQNKLTKIPLEEISFNSLSFSDPGGRLFSWNNGLYRAIAPEQSEFYRELCQKNIIQTLIDQKKLVDTTVTDLKTDHYDLVLQHQKISFVSYPHEWCDTMLKDAALLHLDLCLALDEYELTTDDALPFNILFDGCKAVFVDFTSIIPLSKTEVSVHWNFSGQFHQLFIHPLQTMACGYSHIARSLLKEYDRGISAEEVQAFISQAQNKRKNQKFPARFWNSTAAKGINHRIKGFVKSMKGRSLDDSTARRLFLEELREKVEEVDCSKSTHTFIIPNEKDYVPQLQILEKLLVDLRPESILNLSFGDAGILYTQLALLYAQNVVSIHSDEKQVRALYSQGKNQDKSVLPILIDITLPGSNFTNDWFKSAYDRFQCDLVLAIDVVERLVFQEQFRFDLIVHQLAGFSKKSLILNFKPKEDPYLKSATTGQRFGLSWYNESNLIRMLEEKFSQVRIIYRDIQSYTWILCQQ